MEDLDISTALRRPSPNLNVRPEERQASKKRRSAIHSDASSTAQSSGLTPMVQRASLTASSRRSATPASGAGSAPRSSNRPAAVNLQQTIDGRIERQTHRSGLRDMLHKVTEEKHRNEQLAKAQITKLKAELRARDREIYRMQNATMVFDTERIWELEQQVKELKGQLATKGTESEETSQYYSCVWPSTDDLMDVARDEDHFGDPAKITTPRAKPSFLTPPATSPTGSTLVSPIADTQQNPPDLDKKQLKDEIASMQSEVQRLTVTLDTYNAWGVRVSEALSNGTLKERGALPSPSAVENHIQSLLQTMAERDAAAEHLTASIAELGFPGADAGGMIMSLASGFRAARLELEDIAPGEITLPFTACGADILDTLLDRLRILSRKTGEDEDLIEQYHETERSLRKQLDSQNLVMEELNIRIVQTCRALHEKDGRIRELEGLTKRMDGHRQAKSYSTQQSLR
ncbi:hypothetical protein ACQKWADRAFT_286118 [Trichoderma austrokoningii]